MKIEKIPVGRRSLLGLIYFYVTDAIAGISSGTTVRYVDSYKGSNVNSYSRLIGVLLISSPDSNLGYAVVACDAYTSRTLGVMFSSGYLSTDSDSSYKIRVFYY